MTRLIDADALKRIYNGNGAFTEAHFRTAIDEQPTVDAVPVVRCGECKHYNDRIKQCSVTWIWRDKDWFCANGERREDE